MSRHLDQVIIARRFRGPPDSGNGGYSCGLLARHFDGPVEVTLKAPPPVDTPMAIVGGATRVRLMHGDSEIASAIPAVLELEVPEAPSLEQAAAASDRYVTPDAHGIPECFVCGPKRLPGDGLCIFAGPDPDRGIAAAVWTPEAGHAGADGRVAKEIVWSALDCPGYFGLMAPGLPALLGRMTAGIVEAPHAAEPCIVIGWKIDHEGRKYHAGTALFDASGRLLARSRQTWIELRHG